jgi:hypothetical protein
MFQTILYRVVPIVAVVALVCMIGGCHRKHHHHHHAKTEQHHLQAPVLTGTPGRGVHQIDLRWTNVGATTYRVIRVDVQPERVILTTTGTHARAKRLDQTRTYRYVVEAIRGTEKARSNVVELKPRAIPGNGEPPAPHCNG